jgi:hypothetical protein
MKRQILGLLRVTFGAAFFITASASAQNAGTVTNHAVVLGKGAGVQGFGSLLLGSGQIAIGQSSADPTAITPSGDVTINATGVTAIGANKITNTQLRQSGALALVGRSANSTGNVADIQATAGSSCVFMESSSSLACGAIVTANIAANAVTNAKLATMTANTLKANATSGSAAPTDVAPASARSSSLLNVDSFTGHGDSIYSILATDRTVGTNAAFTASRTWTLPAANAVNPGQEIIVADFQGTVTGTNTLVISRAGSDTVNGGTSATISAANGAYLLKSDGVSKWTAQALGAAAAGGVSSITCFGTAITTSGTCATAATKSDEQTGTSTTAVVTPTQQQSHDSAVKAWCFFSGTATGTNACTIGYNVTSTTRASTGSYSLNFTTAFASSTSYFCTGMIGGSAQNGVLQGLNAQTASAYPFVAETFASVAQDVTTIGIACYGRQ